MDYARIYDRLINRARDRVLVGYSEKHHVLPRCMGGDNSPENIVRLTAEEHFVGHQLLVKMHPDDSRLLLALNCMRRNSRGRRNNKIYGWIRRRVGEEMRRRKIGIPRTPEVVEKLRRAATGKKQSKATLEKRSAIFKGRKLTAEHSAKIAAALKGNKCNTPENVANFIASNAAKTPEQRSANMRKGWQRRRESGNDSGAGHPLTGRKMPAEHRAKIALAGIGRKYSLQSREKMRAKALLREARRRASPEQGQLELC